MSKRTCLAIVLAAGEGTRMRSAKPKVLHAVAGRSLLAHVLCAVRSAGMTAAVVVGPDSEAVAAEARSVLPKAEIFVQSERRGTAHAVLAARAAIERGVDDVVVIFGDTPLISVETLRRLRAAIDHHASVAVLGFRPQNPAGYGRLITIGHRLVAIREERDATDIERRIDLCNGGLMALRGEVALDILDRIDDKNAKGEFYLTDAVAIADAMALESVALEAREEEVLGVDNRSKLADADGAGERLVVQALFQVLQFAFGAAARELAALQRGDARGIIATIFEPLQRIDQLSGDGLAAEYPNDPTHG
jgi:bifunctional UDP-N-acetylglucosamine pyrophosphorylase/glucosamine-1-phosphate N-acetyltransferase